MKAYDFFLMLGALHAAHDLTPNFRKTMALAFTALGLLAMYFGK